MSGESFDQDAWLDRIGYRGPREATLAVLRDLVYAHATAISYESIDVLLDRPPTLDLAIIRMVWLFRVSITRGKRAGRGCGAAPDRADCPGSGTAV